MPRKKTIRRLILNFPGFEPTTSTKQIERLTHGGEKAGELWGFELTRKTLETDPASSFAVADFSSKGEGWQTETRFVQFSWSDVIAAYENAPYPQSLVSNFPKYLSFFLDGSVWRYWKASIRYWGFTIYPLLLMILFAIIAVWVTGLTAGWLGIPELFRWIAAFIVWLILCKYPGDLVYVNLSINDWGFARDMCNRSNPEIEARYDLFADRLRNEINSGNYDEVLLVGHSFGAVWAISALSRALQTDNNLIGNKKMTFLALGSSLLKIALAPAAQFLRDDISRVTKQKNLLWHEIQTKTDFISFYKSDPFPVLGIENVACEYQVHRVNFRRALSPQRLRKMRKSFYLAHRQYILYCDKRVHFDFQLRCFGPWFAHDLARDTTLIEGQTNA